MTTHVFLGLTLAALIAATPGRADAQEGLQRVAVVRLEFQGSVPEAARARISQRVVEGLAAARFEVLAGDALQRRLTTNGGHACSEPSCYPDFARSLGVGYLVSGKLVEQDKTYDIRLELLNGRTGGSLASVHERCETCGLEDAAEKVNLAASALRARLEAVTRMPARFVIRSRPQSAVARIDGKPVGVTPLDLEISSGEHQLTLEKLDHEPLRRTFVVVSGVDETLDLELVRQATTFPYRPIGWAGLSVGALAIAGGIVALVADGKQISCPRAKQDSMMHCPYVRDTSVLGAVLLGVGSASAAVGGISLYLGSQSTPESSGREVALNYHRRF
jgi:hypothetical protein